MTMKTSGWPTTSRHERGYGTEWSKLRLDILRRDNGLCQCEQCKGGQIRVRIATEVHHIVSKAKAETLGWTKAQTDDPSNLSAINRDCHKRETAKEQGRQLVFRPRIGIDGYPVEKSAP